MVVPVLRTRLGPPALSIYFAAVTTVFAQPFQLPTANRALFEPAGEEKFFVGTVGKTWTSGCYGCVRSDGWQMHEGLDIRCLQRDKHGEPTDPVLASADGTVVYISTKPSLSNYGNYLVVCHQVEDLEICSWVFEVWPMVAMVWPAFRDWPALRPGAMALRCA